MNEFVKSRLRSFRYAFQGVQELFMNHPNAQIHLAFTIVALVLSVSLDISQYEWLAIIIVIGMVLSAEAINSAIEILLDHLNPGFHPAVGKVKDLAAGAVLLTAISAALIGILIFLPKILALF